MALPLYSLWLYILVLSLYTARPRVRMLASRGSNSMLEHACTGERQHAGRAVKKYYLSAKAARYENTIKGIKIAGSACCSAQHSSSALFPAAVGAAAGEAAAGGAAAVRVGAVACHVTKAGDEAGEAPVPCLTAVPLAVCFAGAALALFPKGAAGLSSSSSSSSEPLGLAGPTAVLFFRGLPRFLAAGNCSPTVPVRVFVCACVFVFSRGPCHTCTCAEVVNLGQA
eukprot:1156858-Pelagomonas_calceolata.AAC.5